MKERLTNEEYWNTVWSKSKHHKDSKILIDTYFEDDFMSQISYIKKSGNYKIIELGASGNGQFIYIFNKYFGGAKISALDFDRASLQKTQELCEKNGIDISTINDDALKLENVRGKFNIVSSFGLIEHFSELEAENLIRNHFKVCENNGYVIITVPNFNSIIYKIQYTLFMPFTLYRTHNLKIMKLKFLKKVMSKYGDIQYAGYVGGKYNPPGVKPFKYIFNLLNKVNIHRFKNIFYPSIMVVAKKVD